MEMIVDRKVNNATILDRPATAGKDYFNFPTFQNFRNRKIKKFHNTIFCV